LYDYLGVPALVGVKRYFRLPVQSKGYFKKVVKNAVGLRKVVPAILGFLHGRGWG
jgi:hypothetical protein